MLESYLNDSEDERYVLHRRFDRMGRLIGDEAMKRLFNSHVLVIGLGGVGSWAAESLARSGVGRLTLVDFDDICITNANRQLHALQGLVGQKKAVVMGERLQKINPKAQVNAIPHFYNEGRSTEILETLPDFVIDAIDNVTAKCHLLATCKEKEIPVITSGGAGARLDPLQIQMQDLARTHDDPLAQQIRKILRQKYGFAKEGEFGIPCVFSTEPTRDPIDLHYDHGKGFKCVCPQGKNGQHECERRHRIYGNASFVTGTFGLIMASHVVRQLVA